MREINFKIKQLPPMLNSYMAMPWYKKKQVRDLFGRLIYFAIDRKIFKEIQQKPFSKYKVCLERQSPREPDYDGLVGSFKLVIDQLTFPLAKKKYGFCLLEDDKYKNTGQWDVRWVKTSKKDQCISVRILEKEQSDFN